MKFKESTQCILQYGLVLTYINETFVDMHNSIDIISCERLCLESTSQANYNSFSL